MCPRYTFSKFQRTLLLERSTAKDSLYYTCLPLQQNKTLLISLLFLRFEKVSGCLGVAADDSNLLLLFSIVRDVLLFDSSKKRKKKPRHLLKQGCCHVLWQWRYRCSKFLWGFLFLIFKLWTIMFGDRIKEFSFKTLSSVIKTEFEALRTVRI